MRQAGLSATAYGLTVAVNGVTIVLVQPVTVSWLTRRDHSRVIAVGQLLVGLGFGLTQFASGVPSTWSPWWCGPWVRSPPSP